MGRDEDAAFVRNYEALVRGIAKQTRAQLGLEVDMEDLVSFGFTGLLEARARFDASQGVPFKSFAYYRVRGAIIDGVRAMAYLPRRAYARLRAAETIDRVAEGMAHQSAASKRAGQPEGTTSESVRALDGVLGQAAAAYCASLAKDEERETADSPERAAIAAERRAAVRQAVAKLPDRERQLVQGHDLEGRRLDEVAAELGLSKSWASRIHGKGLERLRKLLSEL